MDCGLEHEPVLAREVVEWLAPAGRRVLVDCTIGAGGHARRLLEAAGPRGVLIGLDVDEGNLLLARERLGELSPRARLFRANFSALPAVLAQAGEPRADAILADLGVASTQLDDPARGLSFAVDGPLDMRMDDRLDRTAGNLVNDLPEKELADLIYALGEERYSRRIAKAIVGARRGARIGRTAELARIVAQAVPAPARAARRGVHPATRTFQALRIAVNDELGCLERLLEAIPSALTEGGRAVIISFHSLEDRRVKRAFAGWAAEGLARLLTRKPLRPSAEEMERNPRSRSAKMRGIERLA